MTDRDTLFNQIQEAAKALMEAAGSILAFQEHLEAMNDAANQQGQEQQWPPAGMAIQVYCRRPHGGNYGESRHPEWRMAVSRGDGYYTYTANDDARLKPLENRGWRYLPAPWELRPRWAKAWIATDDGQYLWSRMDDIEAIEEEFDIGVLHMEHV